MDLDEFKRSLISGSPPKGVSSLLLALWYDAKGDWEKSHEIAQDIDTKEAALVHAYLHRKEGDLWNADYWYRRAGSKSPDMELIAEWQALVKSFSE